MNGIRPKQHARIGEFHLEEAVLDVLLDARHEGSCIGAAEISKRAGIYRDRGTINTMNDAIVTGLLVKLHEQRRVQKCAQDPDRPDRQNGWELTEKEFTSRRDDISA